MSGQIKRHVLPNLPYVALFWFFSRCGGLYRMSPGKDTLFRLMNTIASLRAVFSRHIPTPDSFDISVGLIGAAAVYLFVMYKRKTRKKWRHDLEYGSARWGGKKDIEPYLDPVPDNNIILTATESLTLNGRPKNPKYARNKNVLVIGGSGSGKTRFFVKPNICQLHSSYCITDPKGQLVIETGKLLKRAGYEIKILNTIDFKKSLHYNPFHYIRSEKDILKFVTALIANTNSSEQKSSDPFWEKSEILLYCALIGYIMQKAADHEKNINSLVELINSMEVHEEDDSYMNAVDFLFERLEKGVPLLDDEDNPVIDENGSVVWEFEPHPQHFAVRQYKKYKLAAGVVCCKRLIHHILVNNTFTAYFYAERSRI
jgi:type IV secretion system protein VirD4